MVTQILRVLAVVAAALGASNAEELAPAVPLFKELATIAVTLTAFFAQGPQRSRRKK